MTPPDCGPVRSIGEVAEGFEPVRVALDQFIAADPAFSGQVSAYWRGRKVVDLAGGRDTGLRTVAGVYSVSKGVSALTLSLLVQRGTLDLDQRVAHYWPEFAAHGKGAVSVRQLLTHQVGLLGTIDGLTLDDFCGSEAAAAKLAATRPYWRPGSTFGYHGLTIGVFMEELCRRIDGRSLQKLYAEEIRDPYEIDFYLGIPPAEEARFRPILPPLDAGAYELTTHADDVDSLAMGTGRVEQSGRPDIGYLANDPGVRRAGVAAVGGVGCAEGLARLYAAATTGVDGREPFLTGPTIATMSQEQVWGLDRVLNVQMCFGVVFMKPQPRMDFASYQGFGHDGAGGGLGCADPMYDLAFGYIPQRRTTVESGRFVRLSRVVREVIAAQTT